MILRKIFRNYCSRYAIFASDTGFASEREKRKRKERWTRIYPFEALDNTKEIQRAFQAGRMDVLFNLVDDGKISLDEVARFTGLKFEDVQDMLFGWQEAQKM